MVRKANPQEMAPFYHRYLDQLPEGEVLDLLRRQAEAVKAMAGKLPAEKQAFAYAPGKWTVKEVFGHMIDTERIMAYRAVCLSRGETQPLPGFDENRYVANAGFDRREFSSLFREYYLLRQSNLALFESFDEGMLQATGTVNNDTATVRGIVTIIAAHEFHHLQILKQRYLVAF